MRPGRPSGEFPAPLAGNSPESAPNAEALVARLRAAGCVFAEDEAALLLDEADSARHLETLVARRVSGEPLEQVLGWASFCGLRIIVEPGVFVPRQRTALVAREGAALARRGSVVLDLCCGSGAVGAAVAAAVDGIALHAADIDPVAVRCAVRNVAPYRGQAHQGDLYDAVPPSLQGRVDVLVVNAPYVPSDAVRLMPPEARVHEPLVALDGGPDGVDVHRRVAANAVDWLAPDGHLLIETSDAQAPLTLAAMSAVGLRTHVVADPSLEATVAVGRLS